MYNGPSESYLPPDPLNFNEMSYEERMANDIKTRQRTLQEVGVICLHLKALKLVDENGDKINRSAKDLQKIGKEVYDLFKALIDYSNADKDLEDHSDSIVNRDVTLNDDFINKTIRHERENKMTSFIMGKKDIAKNITKWMDALAPVIAENKRFKDIYFDFGNTSNPIIKVDNIYCNRDMFKSIICVLFSLAEAKASLASSPPNRFAMFIYKGTEYLAEMLWNPDEICYDYILGINDEVILKKSDMEKLSIKPELDLEVLAEKYNSKFNKE